MMTNSKNIKGKGFHPSQLKKNPENSWPAKRASMKRRKCLKLLVNRPERRKKSLIISIFLILLPRPQKRMAQPKIIIKKKMVAGASCALSGRTMTTLGTWHTALRVRRISTESEVKQKRKEPILQNNAASFPSCSFPTILQGAGVVNVPGSWQLRMLYI